MIDWFVLLIPLVLLPIFLLFVFVGCHTILGLDEFLEPIYFSYDGGLSGEDDNSDIQAFRMEIWFEGKVIGTMERSNPIFPSPDDPPKIEEDGETDLGVAAIGLDKEGDIECTVNGTLQSGEPFAEVKHKENKIEDQIPPKFRLARDPNPDHLFRIL